MKASTLQPQRLACKQNTLQAGVPGRREQQVCVL